MDSSFIKIISSDRYSTSLRFKAPHSLFGAAGLAGVDIAIGCKQRGIDAFVPITVTILQVSVPTFVRSFPL